MPKLCQMTLEYLLTSLTATSKCEIYRRLALLHTPSVAQRDWVLHDRLHGLMRALLDQYALISYNMPGLQQVPHNHLAKLKCLIGFSHLSLISLYFSA